MSQNQGRPQFSQHSWKPKLPTQPGHHSHDQQPQDFSTQQQPVNQQEFTSQHYPFHQEPPWGPTSANNGASYPPVNDQTTQFPGTPQQGNTTRSLTTGTLPNQFGEYSGQTGMLTLNQAVKVVRVPVAGQPGQYKTGILPVQPTLARQTTAQLPDQSSKVTGKNKRLFVSLAAVVLIILITSGVYLIAQPASRGTQTNPMGPTQNTQANQQATVQANIHATATAANSIIYANPMLNAPGWSNNPKASGGRIYAFKDDGYHLRQDGEYQANAAAPVDAKQITAKFTYSVNIKIADSDDTEHAYAALLLRYSEKNNGEQAFFYVFKIINTTDTKKYEFAKYDGSKPQDELWSVIYEKDAGKELKGAKDKNNVKIAVDGKKFTFSINGKEVGKAENGDYKSGLVGLAVNNKGTEAVFTDLSLIAM